VKLSPEQIAQFDEQGYLFLPKVFSDPEVRALMREVPGILGQERPQVVREKDGKTPRTALAVHTYNDVFARLARHPRLIEPVEQLLDEVSDELGCDLFEAFDLDPHTVGDWLSAGFPPADGAFDHTEVVGEPVLG
jgi:hypothetical protein